MARLDGRTTPPHLYQLNAMELVLPYMPSWHRSLDNEHPQITRGNDVVMHSLRAVYYEFIEGKLHVESIHTSDEHNKYYPLDKRTPDLAQRMLLYWPNLNQSLTQTRFEKNQAKKHLKYFHSHPLFPSRVNMFQYGLDLGEQFLVEGINHFHLKSIIFSKYKIGDIINCDVFVKYLESRIGHKIRVTFSWTRGRTLTPYLIKYLFEIRILFDLERKMLDYDVAQKTYTDKCVFLLEGVPGGQEEEREEDREEERGNQEEAEEERENQEEASRKMEKKARKKKHFFWGCMKPFSSISRMCRS